MTAVGVLLEGAVREKSLQKDLAEACKATKDFTARATAVGANVKVLKTGLTKRKADVTRLCADLLTTNDTKTKLRKGF